MSGNRKELRLREFSYSEKAAYFITICCRGGEHLLCEIEAETPTPTGFCGTGQKRFNERVPAFVSYFKRSTNRSSGMEIWQRGYYDHVVRDYPDYCRIWNYIDNNPCRWFEDKYYT